MMFTNLKSRWQHLPITGILVIFGGFLTQVPFGMFYTIGNMIPYVTTYLRNETGLYHVSNTELVWVFGSLRITEGVFILIGGLISAQWGTRYACLLGTIAYSAGYFITFWTLDVGLFPVILSWGALSGIGVGLGYFSPVACALRWFPGRKGLICGILASAISLGGFIFTPMQTWYINPNNEHVNNEGVFTHRDLIPKVKDIFMIEAIICLAIGLTGTIFIKNVQEEKVEERKSANSIDYNQQPKPRDLNESLELSYHSNDLNYNTYTQPNGKQPIANQNILNAQLVSSNGSPNGGHFECNPDMQKGYLTPKEFLRVREFYILTATFLFLVELLSIMASVYKIYGQTFIKDDRFMALVGMFAYVAGGLGRIWWGYCFDKIRYKKSMWSMCSILGVFILTLTLTPYGGKTMYGIWIWAIYFAEAGIFVLVPTVIEREFGYQFVLQNYGLVALSLSLTGPGTALLSNILVKNLGWIGLFTAIAVTMVIVIVMTAFFRERSNSYTQHVVSAVNNAYISPNEKGDNGDHIKVENCAQRL